jgi:hypothetical protein
VVTQATKQDVHAVEHASSTDNEVSRGNNAVRIALAWLFVSIPLGWGVFETLRKAVHLFQ